MFQSNTYGVIVTTSQIRAFKNVTKQNEFFNRKSLISKVNQKDNNILVQYLFPFNMIYYNPYFKTNLRKLRKLRINSLFNKVILN